MRIRVYSEKSGPVDFDVVGNTVCRQDLKGEHFAPTRTYDSSMKWVLDEITRMRQESPDLYFTR